MQKRVGGNPVVILLCPRGTREGISHLFSAGISGRVAGMGVSQQCALPPALDYGVDRILSVRG